MLWSVVETRVVGRQGPQATTYLPPSFQTCQGVFGSVLEARQTK